MRAFYRVDSRLVHGQIISTWLPHLRISSFLIVSDTVPTNTLQMTMFRMAIPEEVEFNAMPIGDAVEWLNHRLDPNRLTMVLFESIHDAKRLFDSGHLFGRINLGNIHHRPDRKAFSNAVYLGSTEIEHLNQLIARGVAAEIQTLPSETPVNVRALIEAT